MFRFLTQKKLSLGLIVLSSAFCFVSFVFAAVCSVLFLSPSTHAYSLSISADDVYVEITSGKTSVKEAEIEVTTNCRAGYNFSISTTTNPSLYLNGNSSNTATFTAVNGTNALSNSANQNKWGYYYNSNQSTVPTDSSTFLPLSTAQTTLRTPSQTASPSADINDDFSIYYGVNAGASVVPGLYYMANSGKINYYATADTSCDVVNIAYDGNNATAGTMGASGTGVIHTGVKDGDTIDLIASNFSKTGYGFAGWSLDPNAGAKLIDNNSSNNPVVYGPQETVTLPQGFTNNDTDNDGIVKLYAVWIPSQGNLQGWTGCANLDTATYDSTTGALDLTKNSVTALTDQRDNQVYAIARLADGKCWMIENLRLDNNATTPNWGDDFLSQGFGGVFTGLAAAEGPSLFANVTTANSLYSTDGSNNTINIGTSSAFLFPRYNNTNTSTRATNPTANTEAMYSYGNYYTWAAAIADTTFHATNNQSVTGTSICPAGWHLPTGGMAYASGNTSGVNVTGDTSTFREFYNLGYKIMNEVKTAYEDTSSAGISYYSSKTTNIAGNTATKAFRKYPNNFVYTGIIYSGLVSNRGSNGGYWSSTTDYSSTNAYVLSLTSSSVHPGTTNPYRYQGNSIRCIASDPETFTLTYNANGGSGTPSSQSTTANGLATFTVSNTTPTRSGYTFAGWIDEKGNEAQPGGTFRTKDTNAVLYARWTNNSCNPSATTIGTGNSSTDAVCLQDVKLSMKSSLPTATSTTGTYNLIDARDGQSYTVAKLPDGNLWLTKNLNYGSSSDTLLTSYDTDLPSNTTFMSPASTSTFSTGVDYYTTPQIQSNVTTYGGYYSYAAAIASTTAYSTANQNITTSICPKGWDLPTSASYTYLKNSASLTNYSNASVAPYSFTYGGYKNGANFTSQTTRGDLWTSSNLSKSYGQELYTTSAGFNVLANNSINYKYYGKTVRCIASNGTATVNYNANGGSGTMASQSGDINSISISSNTFTAPTGYSFKNWNTAANGSGTTVAVSAALSSIASNGDTITLYAQWNPIYKITYVNNCATFNTGCTASTSNGISVLNIILSNNPSTGTETGTLGATNVWTQTNYKITSWNTAADGSGTSYVPSSTFTVPTGSVPGDGITLYAQWTPTYTIVFDGNGATNAMTGMRNSSEYSVKYTNVGGGDEIELLAPNYYKTGYGFAGWSFDSSATPDGSATIYGPNESIIAPTSSTPGETKTLYAVWVASAGNIQNWSGCSSMSEGDVTALTDQRDNNVYTVGKLEDGNCWMMENLRLSNNTSAPNWGNDNLSQGFGGAFSGLAASESANFSNVTTANTLYSTTNITGNSQGYRFPRYNNSNTASLLSSPTKTRNYANTASPSNSGTYEGSTVYSYGNYYTWNAAMASTEGFTTESASESAGTSICPAGWHLPTGGASNGTNDFYDLTTTISGTEPETGSTNYKYWGSEATAKPVYDALKKFPNNFVWSGYWNTSSASSRGSRGWYWSTSVFSSTAAYYLNYYSARVYPATYNDYRYLGNSVRCISSTYNINLSVSQGTLGSTSTTAAYGSTTLGTITNPTRESAVNTYNFTGFTLLSSATGASVSSTDTISVVRTTPYAFKGWYESTAGSSTLIASNDTTPALQASTTYTNSDSQWTYKTDNTVTLYGKWETGTSVVEPAILPTITLAGHECGWSLSNTATTIDYASGGTIGLMNNMVPSRPLYGVCIPIHFTLVFDGNGATNATTGMRNSSGYTVKFTNVAPESEVELLAPNYYKTDYGFAGWSFYADGTGQTYGPNETITLPNASTISTLIDANNTVKLYAKWVQSAGTMQNWNGCDSMSIGNVTALTDSRDNSVYTVGKLVDGSCWMMENLRLDAANSSNSALAQDFGGVFTGLANSESANFANSTTANSKYSTSNITGANQGYRIPRYNNTNTASLQTNPSYTRDYTDPTSPTESGTYPTSNVYSYGNYYNWPAVIASTLNYTTVNTHTNTSICPIGWRLPYGPSNFNNSYNDYYELTTTISNLELSSDNFWDGNDAELVLRALKSYPNNFVYSGEISGQTYYERSTGFQYWTGTSDSTNVVNTLWYDGDSLVPAVDYASSKYLGFSARCVAAKGINYHANGSNVQGTMGIQQAGNNQQVTLLASNFSRSGYGFAGWSTDPNAQPGGSSTIYGPNETITTASNFTTTGLTLYAVWVQSASNLQNWNGCDSMSIGDVTALTDTRDSNVYTVGKLADGNCWMMENLRLDAANSANSSLAQGFGGVFTGLANSEQLANFTNVTTANSKYSTTNITGNYQSYRFPRYNNINTASRASSPTSGNNNIYSYGNYYTWAAAMANTNILNTRTESERARTSICPAGWRLPTGGDYKTGTNDFYILTKTISGTEPGEYGYWEEEADDDVDAVLQPLTSYPNNYIYSGFIYDNIVRSRNDSGELWSTSAQGGAYNLSYGSGSVDPANAFERDKYHGLPIRCIISPPRITDLTYMQDFASLGDDDKASVLDSMITDQQYQLTDSRDGKTYWISKLQDGHVWMTQNLDLDLGVNTLTHNSTTLYHDDTDLGWGTDTATQNWTPVNATQTVTYDSNMKGTFTSLGTTATDDTVPKSLDVGDWYYAGYDGTTLLTSTIVNYLTSDNRTNINGVVTVNDGSGNDYFSTAPFSINGNHGHLGNYYNWTAAVASNNTSSYTSYTLSNIANNPQNSICPAGWRLPTITSASPTYNTAGSKNEFARLANLYANYVGNTSISSAGLEATPLFFARSGGINGSSLNLSGFQGYYWSSTVISNTNTSTFMLGATIVSPQAGGNRYAGRSVRCLVR
ncbi:InlB B-repeat-containing protein [Candidatus Saccharibacteria bacterium]|nr:InlB B-repeat-containing protein [Candidatus Saccharibacteria bacterium]